MKSPVDENDDPVTQMRCLAPCGRVPATGTDNELRDEMKSSRG